MLRYGLLLLLAACCCWPGVCTARELLQQNDCVINDLGGGKLRWDGFSKFANLSLSAGADDSCDTK